MRIEIIVGSSEPAIYPLSRPKITIGSSDSCEIVLTNNGISRKHITIISENDSYSVIDQGSTNGSFMNEERLIPGKKIEFTSFFPIRLGDDVVISLLSDDESRNSIITPLRDKVSENSRTDISRPDMTSTSLRRDATGTFTNLKNSKNTNTAKSKSNGKKVSTGNNSAKKKFSPVPVAAFLILAAAVYWNLFVKKIEADPEVAAATAVEDYKIQKIKPVEPEHTDLIKKEELIPKDQFGKYQGDIKCASDIEIYFCNMFPGIKNGKFGVVQSKLNVNIMLDGTPYFEEAKKAIDPYTHFTPPTPGQTTTVQSNERADVFTNTHYNMAAFLFLMKHLPLLDEAKTQDLIISVAFYSKNSPDTPVKVMAFTSKGFNKIKPTLKEDHLIPLRNNNEAGLEPLASAIQLY